MDTRAAIVIFALAASACASAPASPVEIASACTETNSALEVKTCGKEVDAVRDKRPSSDTVPGTLSRSGE